MGLSMGVGVCDDVAAWNEGKSFGAQVKTHYGTQIHTHLVEPMTSTSKPFTTMDGSKSFTANMTCEESVKSFMTLTYSLGSPHNGIVPIIKIDKDLDGTKELTFVSAYTASAICSNGIAVCSGGVFTPGNSCTYYTWSYNGSSLSLVSAPSNTLSACRCVNDTCGGIATTEKDSLVGIIATNVYSTLSAYSAAYVISSVRIYGGTAEYFGQRADTCSNFQGSVVTTGTSTAIDPSSQIIAQASEPKSAYAALLGTSQNYSTHAKSVESEVNATKTVSKSTRASITHQDGTTDFTTKNYATGTTLNGHVGIPLTSDEDLYCQVKWLETSNEVFTDSTERSNATSSAQQWQTETRLCINATCPFSPSKAESIKHDCGNINNFSEAASAFSALQELADDITCGSL